MPIHNFEFKARTYQLEELEKRLQELKPRYVGEDNQVDTYFHVAEGRLKLREGNIENTLIYYQRPDTPGAKLSVVLLYTHPPDPALKTILAKALGVKVKVQKKRKIYFVGDVKIHFDTVASLGTFVEVEAIDETGEIGTEALNIQCQDFARFFNLGQENYISGSYSDMLIESDANTP